MYLASQLGRYDERWMGYFILDALDRWVNEKK